MIDHWHSGWFSQGRLRVTVTGSASASVRGSVRSNKPMELLSHTEQRTILRSFERFFLALNPTFKLDAAALSSKLHTTTNTPLVLSSLTPMRLSAIEALPRTVRRGRAGQTVWFWNAKHRAHVLDFLRRGRVDVLVITVLSSHAPLSYEHGAVDVVLLD